MQTYESKLHSGDIKKALKDSLKGTEVWLTDKPGARGLGVLRLRARGGNGRFYFRYVDSTGRQVQIPVEAEGDDVVAQLDTVKARVREMSALYQAGHRNLREYLAELKADKEAAQAAAVAAEVMATSKTLQALLDGYVAHLHRLEKWAEKEARTLFAKNVAGAYPDLAEMPAKDISHRDINRILSALVDAGHGRSAGKLRSYLHAAFSLSIASEYDPAIHPDLHGFGLTANPVAVIPAKRLAALSKPGERVLSEVEMKAFLARLDEQKTLVGDAIRLDDQKTLVAAAIRLALLLGGQRPSQVLRLRPQDVDLAGEALTLFDGKGARTVPREHVLPLVGEALTLVKRLLESGRPFLFQRANVPVRLEDLSACVKGISDNLVEDGVIGQSFQMRDLRRTAETWLAKMGISRDVRAQLLSHGLSGVQQRHYDRYEYFDEKRTALTAWAAKLAAVQQDGQPPSNIVPIKREA